MTGQHPNLDRVWQALDEVKDPELPVISIVELGLIRQVGHAAGRLVVTLSPSFVGCPALDVMRRDVQLRLQELGEGLVEIRTVFSPPWTSDWITPSGREKLRRFGLAPPPRHGGDLTTVLQQAARCPYCESQNTELKNSFGSTPCRSIYYCNSCVQPFEQFKPL
ncbi:MAG: 1,2-phenylacetyl-CoA epoxidase subunit PaaD [Anaerolineales bacterium]